MGLQCFTFLCGLQKKRKKLPVHYPYFVVHCLVPQMASIFALLVVSTFIINEIMPKKWLVLEAAQFSGYVWNRWLITSNMGTTFLCGRKQSSNVLAIFIFILALEYLNISHFHSLPIWLQKDSFLCFFFPPSTASCLTSEWLIHRHKKTKCVCILMEEDNPQFSTVFNPFSHILIPHMHTLSYLTSYKGMLDRFLLACEFGIQCKAICHASTSGREYSTMLALYFNICI